MPTRDEAINIVHTERNYQDAKYPARKSLGAHISLVQAYAQKLSKPGIVAMEVMREIAGISLRAIEEHGAPMRGISGELHATAHPDVTVPKSVPFTGKFSGL